MRSIFGLGIATVALSVAAPASATAVITDCGGGQCFSGLEGVNLDEPATTGHVGNDTTKKVTFSSSVDALVLGQGLATLSASDGLINQITFTLLNGLGFARAELNLQDPANTSTTMVTIVASDGSTQTFAVDSNGSNRFGVDAAGGPLITSVSLSSASGFGSFKQLQLGGVAAVPEPATWAMMLIGFGILGGALRRRKTADRVRVRYA